jgi:hypothetical protein
MNFQGFGLRAIMYVFSFITYVSDGFSRNGIASLFKIKVSQVFVEYLQSFYQASSRFLLFGLPSHY